MKIFELKEKEIGLYKKTPHYNTSEFTVAAQHFKEFGCYTRHPVNTSPNSLWYKFWVQEASRCLYGYNIGRDWIPGYFYWYLNYCPIEKAVSLDASQKESITVKPEISLQYAIEEKNKKDKDVYNLDIPELDEMLSFQGEKVTAFADFWESDYEYFHYLEEAEQCGEHASVLKTRRRGYSYKGGAMLNRNFYLIPRSKSYAFASEKEYLLVDGILTKAWDQMGHIETNTPWGKRKSKVDTQLHKRASYMKMHNGVMSELGFGSEIIGVTFKNNIDKGRGKCFAKGTKIIMFDGRLKNIEDIQVNDLLMGPDGKQRKVLSLHNGIDKMYNIKPLNGLIQTVNSNHDIYYDYRESNFKTSKIKLDKPEFFINSKQFTLKARSSLIKINGLDFIEKQVNIDPYLLGLWLGDGSQGKTEFTLEDKEIIDYLVEYGENNRLYTTFNDKPNCNAITIRLKKRKGILKNWFTNELRRLGIFKSKDIPDDYIYTSRKNRLKLLAGLIDTDGYYDKRYNRIEIIQSRKCLAVKIVYIARSLGIKTSYNIKKIKGYPNDYYRVVLFSKLEQIPTLVRRKQATYYKKQSLDMLKTRFNVEYNGIGEYYGFTLNGDHLFLLEDFTICHNSGKLILWEESGKFPNLLQSWNISLKSMAQGRITFGLMICFGTGGTAIDDLIGLEQLYTRGDGYKVHMIPNRFEPELGHEKTGYFIGEQRNHEIAMDKDGNSDKEKAIQYILKDREDYLNKTKNKEMLLRYIAEAPIKPSEALMQIGGNIFPVDLLKQQKAYLLSHRDTMIDSAWVGLLVPDQETGKIEWKIDNSLIPIDHYPHTDVSNLNGCVVIYEPPVKDKDGNIPFGLYISGNDNYDHDQSTTESLGSTFIMNRMTERIVAEYTGRPYVASYFYNTNRYLLMYYNAIQNFENNLKGLHADFIKNRCEYLLADTPDNVKDKIDDKRVLNRRKGTPGTTPIKKMGREYILEWLMREAEPGTGILNLHKIRSIALLDELIYHNKDGNFDRVDALIYLLIYHEDLWQRIPSYDARPKKEVHQFFANDPLFKLNTQQPKKYIIEKNVMIWPKEKLF